MQLLGPFFNFLLLMGDQKLMTAYCCAKVGSALRGDLDTCISKEGSCSGDVFFFGHKPGLHSISEVAKLRD